MKVDTSNFQSTQTTQSHTPIALKALLQQLGISPDGEQAVLLLAAHGDTLYATLRGSRAPLALVEDGTGAVKIRKTAKAPGQAMSNFLPPGFALLATALAKGFPAQSLPLLRAARACETTNNQVRIAVDKAYAMAKRACEAMTAHTATTTTTTTTNTTWTTQTTSTTTPTASPTTTTTPAPSYPPPVAELSSQALDVQQMNARGAQELADAILSNDPERVQDALTSEFMRRKPKPLANGSMPLQWAAQQGKEKAVACLLATSKLDPNAADDHGSTALHEVARKGDVRIAKLLLTHTRIDLNLRHESGATPFHVAIQSGHLDMAKLLLERGSKLLLTDPVNIHLALNDGTTPLHTACSKGDVQTLNWLLKLPGFRRPNGKPLDMAMALNQPLHNGDTPLHCAAEKGQLEVVKILLQHGPATALNQANKNGWTPLLLAIEKGHTKLVAWLLDRPDICVEAQGTDGIGPLLLASMRGHLHVAKRLQARGANLRAFTKEQVLPLHAACEFGHLEIVQWLLAASAPVSAGGKLRSTSSVVNQPTAHGKTPLQYAAASGNLSLVQWLVQLDGIDPYLADKDGMTALHEAALQGREDIAVALIDAMPSGLPPQQHAQATPILLAIQHNHLALAEQLLRHGADPFRPTEGGVTPLFAACMAGQLDAVKWFLSYTSMSLRNSSAMHRAISLNHTLQDGSSLLLCAARAKRWPVVEFLLRQDGIDVNQVNAAGWTLLHELAQTHRVGMARLVLSSPNARLGAASRSGHTPLQLAIENNQVPMAKLLLNHGDDIHHTRKGGWTLLHVACAHGHLEAVDWLLSQPDIPQLNRQPHALASVLNARTAWGDTPLLLAAKVGHLKVVRHLLLQEGIDPAQADTHGRTALHIAAADNDIELADMLVTFDKAHIDAATRNGVTPLFTAIKKNHVDLANLLLTHGADINRHRSDGCTPLHVICATNDCERVWALLCSRDILANKANMEHMAPMHSAALQGHFGVVALLLEHKSIDVFLRGPNGFTALQFAMIGKNPSGVVSAIRRALPPEVFEKLACMRDHWDTQAASLATEFGCDENLVRQLPFAPQAKPVPFQPNSHKQAWCVIGKGTVDDKARPLAELGRAAGLQMQAYGDGASDLTWAGLRQLEIQGGDVVVCQLRCFVDKTSGRKMMSLGPNEVVPMSEVARVFLEKGVLRVLFVNTDPSDEDAMLLSRFKNDPALRRPVDSRGGLPGLEYTLAGNLPPNATQSSTEAVALWFQDGAAQHQHLSTVSALRSAATQRLAVLSWNTSKKTMTLDTVTPTLVSVVAPAVMQRPRLKTVTS